MDTDTQADIQAALENLVDAKTYVCVPAVRSIQSGDYRIGRYGKMGEVSAISRALYQDLNAFRDWQKSTGSPYSSFFAVFENESFSEEEFETALWKELSHLCGHDGPNSKWDPSFSSNPEDQNFCPSIGGEAYFVVGLHPGSSRKARQFDYPTIVFNLYDQFEELDRRGMYEGVVKANRKREIAAHGSINPMVEKYGDKWEAIQFSGKQNDSQWKCPFHHLHSEK